MAHAAAGPGGAVAAGARLALAQALVGVQPEVERDDHSYVTRLEDNLLPGIRRREIADAFGAGAGQELEGKMRAPWSSSALTVNAFAPWKRDPQLLTLTGISGFTNSLAFEAKCPNGISRIPPHLDVLLKRGNEIVAVESKCTEYLSEKKARVSPAYLALAEQGDERASSRWFAALRGAATFRLLDAYQLVKHYLGLRLTYPGRPLTLAYLYWEPTNSGSLPLFAQHRDEIDRFSELVADDTTCRFKSLSYPTHWQELDTQADKPVWLAVHLTQLRRRYDIAL